LVVTICLFKQPHWLPWGPGEVLLLQVPLLLLEVLLFLEEVLRRQRRSSEEAGVARQEHKVGGRAS
jgi:hypothetical protein